MPRDPSAKPLDDRIRAQHMLEAADQARTFAQGRCRADLGADAMLTRALVHAIQEIGEAASKVTDAGRARLPRVPWAKIVGMRHRLVHDYWEINLDHVWAVVERELTPLIDALRAGFATWPMTESARPDEPRDANGPAKT